MLRVCRFRSDDDELPPLPASWSVGASSMASSSAATSSVASSVAAAAEPADREMPGAPTAKSEPYPRDEEAIEAASLEAEKLLKEKPFLTVEQAASKAARRAGLVGVTKAALRAVLLSGDAIASHIPLMVAAAVEGCDQSVCNEEQALRLAAWLRGAPFELRKAKSARAAIQAASQAFGATRADKSAISTMTNAVMARLSVKDSTPPLRVVRSLKLHDTSLPLDTIHDAALAALPEDIHAIAKIEVSIKRSAEMFVALSLPRCGSGAASSDDATLCTNSERAIEAAFAAAAAAEHGAAERAEERRMAAAAWREEVAAWRAARAAHRRVAREAAEAEEDWEASEPAYHGQPPCGRQGKNKPPRRRAPVGVEGRDMRRCARPGVEGRVLRRRGRASACERRRSRLDKGRC